MKEVLEFYRPSIEASDALARLGLTERGYFLVSAHRAENVDPPTRLRSLLDCLVAVRNRFDRPILVSTHPRTRQRLDALEGRPDQAGLTFMEPFGFHDYNKLQSRAACVLSDSGTVSEESALLRFPAVTLRSSIERPEALDTGSIIMTDLDPGRVVDGIEVAMRDQPKTTLPDAYAVEDCSIRVRNFILSTALEHAVWSGLR